MSGQSASAIQRSQVDLMDFIDWSGVECLNQSTSHSLPNALKQGYREDDGLNLESDADEQLLMYIPFMQVIKLHSIMVKGPEEEVDEGMLMALAHQMYKAGNFKQALEHSNAVYERNPQRTDNLLLLGAIHYQLHDFDMCIAKNEEALRIDPCFAECYGNMANAWKEKGNIDFAIRYYLIAIEIRSNFADAWSNLASAYMQKGRFNEAAQCCRQALALNPCLVDAHGNLRNLMKAQGFATGIQLLC